jgi:hypothetical protein
MRIGSGMNRYCRFVCVILYLAFCSGVAFPAELKIAALVGEEAAAALFREGGLQKASLSKNASPSLMPRDEKIKTLLNKIILDIKPTFIVENLSVYKKRDGEGAWNDAERNALVNNLVKVSSLKGLQYFSPSRNEWRLLYEDAYCVENAKSKKVIQDREFKEAPSGYECFAVLTDLTFGENVYKFNYTFNDSSIYLTLQNESKIKKGIFKLSDSGEVVSVVVIFDTDEGILCYAATLTPVPAFPAVKERITASLSARTRAMLTWFNSRADRVFGKR